MMATSPRTKDTHSPTKAEVAYAPVAVDERTSASSPDIRNSTDQPGGFLSVALWLSGLVFLMFLAMMISAPLLADAFYDICKKERFPGVANATTEERDLIYGCASTSAGYTTSLFWTMAFLTAPLLGVLSDRFGRRPLLVLAAVAYAFDLAAFSVVTDRVWPLYFTRAIGGALNGWLGIVFASLADISSTENRVKAFGLIAPPLGVAMVIGPLVGAALTAVVGLQNVFACVGLMLIAAAGYAMFLLPETNQNRTSSFPPLRRLNPLMSFRQLGASRLATCMAVMWFIKFFGEEGIIDNMLFYLKYRFNFGVPQLAVLMALIGLSFALGQTVVLQILVRLLKEQNTLLLGFGLNPLVIIYALVPKWWQVYLVASVRFVSLSGGPLIQACISTRFPRSQQGEISGVLTSLKTLTAALGPLFFNNLFSYFISPKAPLYLPGVVYFACSIVFLINFVFALVIFKCGFITESFTPAERQIDFDHDEPQTELKSAADLGPDSHNDRFDSPTDTKAATAAVSSKHSP